MDTMMILSVGDMILTLTKCEPVLYRLTFHDTHNNKTANIEIRGGEYRPLMMVAAWLAAHCIDVGDLEPWRQELRDNPKIAEHFMP
jgi:hypothetical protein